MPSFYCDACGFQQTVSSTYVGKKVKCPDCQTISLVEDDPGIAVHNSGSERGVSTRRAVAEKRQWNSNPWILTGLVLLLTAINVGITAGGIRLVAKHHLVEAFGKAFGGGN